MRLVADESRKHTGGLSDSLPQYVYVSGLPSHDASVAIIRYFSVKEK